MKKNEFKKLIKTFEMKNIEMEENDKNEENQEILAKKIDEIEKHEIAFSELQEKAMEAYEKLFDLGINSDTRFADKFLEPAIKALQIALEAEKNKIEKKLEAVRINIMKKKSELEEKRLNLQQKIHGVEELKNEENDSLVIDRNRLLEELSKIEEDKNINNQNTDKD